MDIQKIRKQLQDKRNAVSMTKEEVSSMYDNIELETLKKLINDADWYLKSDGRELDETELLIESFYGKTCLAGITDYKDHRNDSLETLKQKTLEDIKTRRMQKGHYYDKDGNPFDGVLLVGQYGGWSAYCVFSNDDNKSFFEFMKS